MSTQYWQIRVARTHETLASRATIAGSLWARMAGLLGRRSLPQGEGLILKTCRSIHTAFMQFPIDAVFVDHAWAVVRICNTLPPWRLSPVVWGAHAVIELPAGTAGTTRLQVGDQLVLEPVQGEIEA